MALTLRLSDLDRSRWIAFDDGIPIGRVPGLRLVGANEAADAAVVPSTAVSPLADGDVPLTPRELEVLALLPEDRRLR
jgi:hypothetical protein